MFDESGDNTAENVLQLELSEQMSNECIMGRDMGMIGADTEVF